MQALLSFDDGPPISAPLRFFVTAPVFAMAAGLLLLWAGPDLYASRWTPTALAFTHLITVGFMMQQHNMKEENVLYPMCDQHLTEQAAPLLAQLRQRLPEGVA